MRYPHALAIVGAAAAIALLTTPTHAQHNRARLITNNLGANAVVEPNLHPEVVVSRSLDAQPVHPHKVKLVMPGRTVEQATMHTWVEADARLNRGNQGLHPNHSIVRALRQARRLRDGGAKLVTATYGEAQQVHHSGHAEQSHARLVVAPYWRLQAEVDRATPAMIFHLPRDGRPRDADPHRARPLDLSPERKPSPKLADASEGGSAAER